MPDCPIHDTARPGGRCAERPTCKLSADERSRVRAILAELPDRARDTGASGREGGRVAAHTLPSEQDSRNMAGLMAHRASELAALMPVRLPVPVRSEPVGSASAELAAERAWRAEVAK